MTTGVVNIFVTDFGEAVLSADFVQGAQNRWPGMAEVETWNLDPDGPDKLFLSVPKWSEILHSAITSAVCDGRHRLLSLADIESYGLPA